MTDLHYGHLLLISIPIYFLFHHFVFRKIIIKHTRRIVSKPENSYCMFSFFNWQSYLIMAFMITLGISVRKYMLLPKEIIAEFYFGLGLALFSAAIYLLYYAMRYGYAQNKFAVKSDTEGSVPLR